MLRQGAPVREFADPASMRAHYRAVRARLWAPRHDAQAVARAEAQQEQAQRAEEARLQAAFAAKAEMDALVFQVLDPAKLVREPRQIITRVAEAFGVSHADIVGPSRLGPHVRARWAAIAAVREVHPDWTMRNLGRVFGDRDHSTMLNAIQKMERDGVPQPPAGGADA